MGKMTIGLVPHPTKPVRDSIEILRTWTQAHGGRLIAVNEDSERVGPGVDIVDDEAFLAEVDVVVALGGDGTMLGAMRQVARRPVPVLGVNYGNLGFLVEVEPDELTTALDRIDRGEFSLEPHHALELTLATADADEEVFLAFNDISVARHPGLGVVSADLTVDHVPHGYYRADAIIASTPAGSTAYNYAAGGPVLSPAVTATVITPVAPMSGISRSVILGPNEVLRFTMRGETPSAAIEIDGRVVSDAGQGSHLTIQLIADAVSVIRLDAARHSGKGRLKLSLLDLPLRSDQLLELVPQEVRKQFRDGVAATRKTLREAAKIEPKP